MPDRMSGCLSDFALEKLVAGDGWETPLSEQEQAHLRVCERCTGRLAEARRLEAEFTGEVLPSIELGGSRGPVPVPRRPLRGFIHLADWRRVLAVHVKRGERVSPYEPGTALHPGDRLRIVPVAPERKHLLLLLRDAAGKVQVLYPWAGSTSGPLPPPGEALPGSFGLDAVLGDEMLVGLASDAPLEAAKIMAWLEQASGSLAPGSAAPVEGADLVVVQYRKVKP